MLSLVLTLVAVTAGFSVDRFHTESILRNLTFDNVDGGKWRQGWDVQYKEKLPLQVYLIPFSHNDPGWVRTFEEYFNTQTTNILTTVVNGLSSDPRRRFMWTEMSYLQRWWDAQSSDMQDKLRRVVDSGQLEITTGGWVMNDEATVHWEAALVQLLEGHSWLARTLQHRPSKGWSIDPFGHSPVQAYLYALAGFDALVNHRYHYRVKKHLAKERALEFFWRQTWQDDKQHTDILTHVFPFYSYDIPHTCGPDPSVCSQFDFARTHTQWGGMVAPITDQNVAERASLLLDQYRKKAELYRTRVLLVTLGDDFRYQTAQEFEAQMTQHQRMHDWLNEDSASNVRVQFGTLREYFGAIAAAHPTAYAPQATPFDAHASPLPDPHPNWAGGPQREGDIAFPLMQGDFFAYSDINTDYWSGYFTSRAHFKLLGRLVQAEVRAAEVAVTWAATSLAAASGAAAAAAASSPAALRLNSAPATLHDARRQLALFQHHDGMTGTAKTYVMDDYAARLRQASAAVQELTASAVALLIAAAGQPPPQLQPLRDGLTSSAPEATATVIAVGSTRQALVYFNPLGHPRSQLVQVRVSSAQVAVTDAAGVGLAAQLNPVWTAPGVVSDVEFSLWFEVSVPALGAATYWIQSSEGNNDNKNKNSRKKDDDGNGGPNGSSSGATLTVATVTLYGADAGSGSQKFAGRDIQRLAAKPGADAPPVLTTEQLKVELDPATGHIRRFSIGDATFGLQEQWVRYGDQGGAYLFQPVDEGVPLRPAPDAAGSSWALVRGPLLDEARPVSLANVRDRVTRVVRSQNDEREGTVVHVEATVDLRDDNVALASRYTADLGPQQAPPEFVTDLNGLSFQRRYFRADRPLQANFYPSCTHIYVEQQQQQQRTRFTVHTRQPFSVSSPRPGSVDLLLDRRLTNDDRRGVEQGVQDNRPTRVQLALTIETLEATKAGEALPQPFPTLDSHLVSRQLNHPLLGFVAPLDGTAAASDGSSPLKPAFRPLRQPLSPELHVVSLRPSLLDEFSGGVPRRAAAADGTNSSNSNSVEKEANEQPAAAAGGGGERRYGATLHVVRPLSHERPAQPLPLSFEAVLGGPCVRLAAYQQHSLTLMHDRGGLESPQTAVDMHPMDIRAFTLQLEGGDGAVCAASAAEQLQLQPLQEEEGAADADDVDANRQRRSKAPGDGGGAPPAAIGPAEAAWFAKGEKAPARSHQAAAVGGLSRLRFRDGAGSSDVVKWVLLVTSLVGAAGLGVYRHQKQRNRKVFNTVFLVLLSFSALWLAVNFLLSSLLRET